ncbi:transcriptional regulator BolA [Pragia fontium]|uniref:DNA-binding transcriptional regulator BolA n=2 Tax=Pragia fontium TaxID=82985 RepID=A0AAJ5BHB6_9GAMM|nr:transcriptional regulator BolA [Pragia fontium]GKX62360.1 transcriptional regulator [Pragia fontium]SFC88556.1 BolA protein [Pragia fontium DSM 5563 = ATCC 49100]SUB83141.1 transcriptional regulator BolA [Pragia fontium]VEJ56035.1 transcriptional regulator BolA [Pragia fontium]
MMQQTIEQKLAALSPVYLKIINESDRHNVPAGSESHFKVVIVSAAFEGKRPVLRHQMVYQILAQELQQQVHALALHTHTPEEWQTQQHAIPASPECRGGSKNA